VPLNVQRGDIVGGDVTEKDNYKFTCYLADSAIFVKLANRERGFKPIFKSEGRGAHHVNELIPDDAQWYAVLDAYGQQYVREVFVNLNRPKRSSSSAMVVGGYVASPLLTRFDANMKPAERALFCRSLCFMRLNCNRTSVLAGYHTALSTVKRREGKRVDLRWNSTLPFRS